MRKIFGSHMVARLEMEKEVLSQFQRLPVLESSYVGLETILGTDEDIEFEDYLSGTFQSLHIIITLRIQFKLNNLYL